MLLFYYIKYCDGSHWLKLTKDIIEVSLVAASVRIKNSGLGIDGIGYVNKALSIPVSEVSVVGVK
jgi:hypothetical protein